MVTIEYIGKCLLVEAENRRILVVGDLHLGYGEAMQVRGVSVGEKEFDEVIEQFERIFEKAGKIDEVVLLGDIKHEFGKVSNQERRQVEKLCEWFFGKGVKNIILIRGNHDIFFDYIRIERLEIKDFYLVGDICFFHGNKEYVEMYDKRIKIWVLGHAHPAISLREGVKEERYKCFLEGEFEGRKVIVLPSFAEHSIGIDPRESDLGFKWKFDFQKFRVKIVGEGLKVMNFGELGKI